MISLMHTGGGLHSCQTPLEKWEARRFETGARGYSGTCVSLLLSFSSLGQPGV